jgi:hypothetical protein
VIKYAEIFAHIFAGARKICILVCVKELKKSATVERTTISLDAEIFKKAKRKSESKGLKFSNYLAGLVSKDVADEVVAVDDPMSSTVIVDLARVLSGEIDAQSIAKKLGSANQPMMLRQWVRDLAESEPEDSERLDIRGELAKQEPIAHRMLREKAERRAKREDGSGTA